MEPTDNQRSALLQNYISAFITLEDFYQKNGDLEKATVVAKLTDDNEFLKGMIKRYFITRGFISSHIAKSQKIASYEFPAPIKARIEGYLEMNDWPLSRVWVIWDDMKLAYQ